MRTYLRRREFIAALGYTAAWPLAAAGAAAWADAAHRRAHGRRRERSRAEDSFLCYPSAGSLSRTCPTDV